VIPRNVTEVSRVFSQAWSRLPYGSSKPSQTLLETIKSVANARGLDVTGAALETASTRIGVRQTGPLVADRGANSCYPYPSHHFRRDSLPSGGGMSLYPYGRLVATMKGEGMVGVLGIGAAWWAKTPTGSYGRWSRIPLVRAPSEGDAPF
jgi:hypothetical protein